MTTPHQLRFAELSAKTMTALLADDLDAARNESGVVLGDLFIDDRAKWLWNFRLKQLQTQPEAADWIARAVLTEPADVVVGYAGFHGPPDANGMVEVGYTVDPQYGWFGPRSARTTWRRWPPSPRSASARTVSSGMRKTAWS
jgi:RimJ/RimL family protein N-acetyltransferase